MAAMIASEAGVGPRNVRQEMSKVRQAGEPSVRSYSVTHPPGRAVLPIEDGWDQLLYTATGTMTISTPAGSWTIPPHRALWIPDGLPATVHNRFRVAVRSLYFASTLHALPAGARAVTVSGLVRELLLHAVRTCPLDTGDHLHAALLTVLLDQLHRLPETSLWLPTPSQPGPARAAAQLISDDPTMTVLDIARAVGTSQRTLERAFLAATGRTLGAWRRRSRILNSLDYLASGMPVTRTALEVGYSTPSAFVTAFRNELGHPPRHFLRH
jgi:AraC-like DNA-binding protein